MKAINFFENKRPNILIRDTEGERVSRDKTVHSRLSFGTEQARD